MNLDDFKEEVISLATIDGAIPFKLPNNSFTKIIKNSKKWFRKNYGDAVERQKFILTLTELSKLSSFTNIERFIPMPDCVVGVTDVLEINHGGLMNLADPDFSLDKLYGNEVMVNLQGGDNLVFMVAMQGFIELGKNFILDSISYDYNMNSRRLKILGREPKHNIMIDTFVDIEESDLFEDELFLRYVVALYKKSLARMISVFNYKLPGGYEISTDAINDEADDEIDKIKEEIDNLQPPDFLIAF